MLVYINNRQEQVILDLCSICDTKPYFLFGYTLETLLWFVRFVEKYSIVAQSENFLRRVSGCQSYNKNIDHLVYIVFTNFRFASVPSPRNWETIQMKTPTFEKRFWYLNLICSWTSWKRGGKVYHKYTESQHVYYPEAKEIQCSTEQIWFNCEIDYPFLPTHDNGDTKLKPWDLIQVASLVSDWLLSTRHVQKSYIMLSHHCWFNVYSCHY